MGHESLPVLPQSCPVELSEPTGFAQAQRVGHMLDGGAFKLGGDDLSAAAVDRARIVAWELQEGDRRNRERGVAAADKLRAMFGAKPPGGS